MSPAPEKTVTVRGHRDRVAMVGAVVGGPLTMEETNIALAIPDWAFPIWMRAGIRLRNGVPGNKAQALAAQELAWAQAKHGRAS